MTVTALRAGFTRFFDADPERLHVAAHSHHPWPDVTYAAQRDAWLDATRLVDHKWEHIFDDVVPETQAWVARRLRLRDPASVAVAPNTHELVNRIMSCLQTPVRILTTGGEFISFERQVRRLAEDDLVAVHRVPVNPVETLTARLVDAAATGDYDLLYVSQVLFETGVAIDLTAVVGAVPDESPYVVVDGYHGFMAVPTDLSALEDRIFYLAGGYKYAMSGEGVCFAHCPPGYGARPRDTGWFADFSSLSEGSARVAYGAGGQRFLGATFDPTALYRFNAVQRWLDGAGVAVEDIHGHVRGVQLRFLGALAERRPSVLGTRTPVVGPSTVGRHGHLLAFDVPHAADVTAALARRRVIVDHRGSLVRFGFGVYHDATDIDRLVERL
jgi:kynureninase